MNVKSTDNTTSTPLSFVPAKALALLCVAALLTHCATARDTYRSVRNASQSSIYEFENVNPAMSPGRDLIQEDFQHSLQGELFGTPFDQRTWGRNCDCL